MKKYQSLLFEIIAIIFLLLVPYAYRFDLGPGPDSLVAMLWDLRFDTPESFFVLISPFWTFFQYNIFRIIFLIITFLFLRGKINAKYFILAGIITDLLVLLISIPGMYILNSDGDNLLPILIPIPSLLLFDILIAYLVSRIKTSS